MKKLVVFALLALAGSLAAQVAAEANSGYKTEQQRANSASSAGDPAGVTRRRIV